MKALGEDPAEFEEVRNSLTGARVPRDDFEQLLVDDMAELRWRRGRLLRAEAGTIASQKREFELAHDRSVARRGKGTEATTDTGVLRNQGLVGAEDCDSKYSVILEELTTLRVSVDEEGFTAKGLALLKTVYGERPGPIGLLLQYYFNKCLKEQEGADRATQDQNQHRFLARLDAEIESFHWLSHLDQEKNGPLTQPMKDAQLLPSERDLEKITRYEAALERLIERKLQQFVSWRREKREGGEREAPQGAAGLQDEESQ
jgi:hypothetical protein